MSVQDTHATGLGPVAAAGDSEAGPERRLSLVLKTIASNLREFAAGAVKLSSEIGVAGAAVLAAGAVLAILCTVWAIAEDVPYSFAVMAGFCTLVCSVSLCAAVLLIQRLISTPRPVAATPGPNYQAWRLVDRFNVSDASRLFCELEPGCRTTQESIAWAQALLDAIKRGDLPVCERSGASQKPEQEALNPNWHTQVTRAALRSWAHTHGHVPRFLQK